MISVGEGNIADVENAPGAHVAQGFSPVPLKGARKMKKAQAFPRGRRDWVYGGVCLKILYEPSQFLFGKKKSEFFGKQMDFASNNLERHPPNCCFNLICELENVTGHQNFFQAKWMYQH